MRVSDLDGECKHMCVLLFHLIPFHLSRVSFLLLVFLPLYYYMHDWTVLDMVRFYYSTTYYIVTFWDISSDGFSGINYNASSIYNHISHLSHLSHLSPSLTIYLKFCHG